VTSLVADLGGTAGFGEFSLARNDDSSTGFIDLTSIFGAQGINFFGHSYTGFYLNNNGSVTFNTATSSFTPSAITGSTSNPVIAAFWADIDTRGGTVTPTPGGTSTGTNLLWYDLDAVTQTFTATWDDVGYFSSQTNKLNAFQLSLHKINAQGDFDITFRYENIDWTTGNASGGSNGLGGTPARAGYSAGNGVQYFELTQSGNEAALLALESASNVGAAGTFVFAVRNGVPTVGVTAGDASISEGSVEDSHYVSIPVYLTEASTSTVTVDYATADGSALAGEDYVAGSGTLTFAPGVMQQNILVAVIADSIVEGNETFTVTLSDPSDGASILDASATGTILNDDVVTSSLSIAATSADKAEGDRGATAFTFTVTRTGDLGSTASVDWAVTGSDVFDADFVPSEELLESADLLSQYASDLGPFFPQIPSEDDADLPVFSLFGGVMPSGTVSFAAGEAFKTITVWVLGETLVELDESFQVTLSDASEGAVIDTASAVGVIRNDEHPDLVLSGVSYTLPTGIANLLLIGTDDVDGTGNELSNILIGNEGHNTLSGLGGTDYLYGQDGNDILIGGAAGIAPNQLWGGEGTDTASYAGTTGTVYADLAALAAYVDGALVDTMNSIENLAAGSGTNTLVGDNAANVLTGGAGIDYLYGQGGDDILAGGAVPAGNTNQLWGGDGSDSASYATTTGVVYADLGVQAGWVDGVLVDEMNSIENLIGSANADTLVGDAGANSFTAGSGADVLWGRGGADVFVFSRHADSNLVTGYDTIGDFVTGVSKIDLRAFATDASHVVIQSDGGSTSLYVMQNASHFDASTDAAIAFIGANAIALGDILFS
jgi:hypothetical protein